MTHIDDFEASTDIVGEPFSGVSLITEDRTLMLGYLLARLHRDDGGRIGELAKEYISAIGHRLDGCEELYMELSAKYDCHVNEK